MAVQKSKKSRSKRDTRRSHHALRSASLRTDQLSGERHRSHHLSADGFYRGEHMVTRKQKKPKETEDTDTDTDAENNA